MEKRVFERMSMDIKARFFSGEFEYAGTITNLSEKGMFISTEVSFPLKPQLEILLPLKEELLNVPVKIRNFEKSGDTYNGIGVELINPPQNYIKFVDNLRSAL